jgi:hypothetical protein
MEGDHNKTQVSNENSYGTKYYNQKIIMIVFWHNQAGDSIKYPDFGFCTWGVLSHRYIV